VIDEGKGRGSLDAGEDIRLGRLLLTRMGRPEYVSSAVLYLASDEAEFVTGVIVPIDGGASAVSGLPWVSAKPPFRRDGTSDEDLVWT
jgi:NAD(P)-dependent dehydrogenase (short-subunit alcohol dehydrogenase family)